MWELPICPPRCSGLRYRLLYKIEIDAGMVTLRQPLGTSVTQFNLSCEVTQDLGTLARGCESRQNLVFAVCSHYCRCRRSLTKRASMLVLQKEVDSAGSAVLNKAWSQRQHLN